MRPTVLGILAAVVLVVAAVLHGRAHLDPFAHARTAPRGPLVTTAIGADTVTTTEPSFGVIAFRVPLPEGTVNADSVELRFREPLDGARVEGFADGPRTHATLLHKRVGGDTIVVPLPPGPIDSVHVRVHRNLRPPPIVRDVVMLTPATPPAAGDPPLAASRQSTR
ncbi:MAG TPA: hypothetical protein VKQ32_20420 [Polyangia bacterium]|nr:hypothetical protein [Polyangia bacterium]